MSTRTLPPAELEKELQARLAAGESARRPLRRGRRSGGRARARYAGLLGVVALMVLGISGAFAVHDEDFQLDGNTTDADVAAAPLDGLVDWETLFNDPDLAETGPGNVPVPDLPLPTNFSEAHFLEDYSLLNGAFVTSDPTTFTQSHDYENISDWRCKLENNVTDKGDITNAYATIFNDGASNIFYFGMEKTSVEGDNNVGIWLLQDPNAGCVGGAGGNGNAFTGNHIAGDIFLVSQFTNGGGVSEIVGYVWADDIDPNKVGNQPGVDPNPFVAGVDCVITGPGDSICATINTETFEPEWTHVDKSLGVNNGLESPAFFEGGIDLSAFPQFTNTCFTGFLFNTRSSQELTATLYDYAFGDIGTCEARISIETSGTNKVGDPHTFTVTVEKNTGGGWVPAVGANVLASELGVGTLAGGTCDNTGGDTNASGQCTIIVDSDAVGQSTVHASSNVQVLNLSIPVSTNGAGAHTVSNVKTWVDARISIGTSGTNKVGDPHTFTVTVEKNLGLGGGWVAAAGVNILASELGVGTVTGGTCDNTGGDTNASGQCTIVVDSDATGQSTVNASGSVDVSGVNVAVATDGYGANTVSNTKTWVDARISIATSGTNKVGDPHTFTVTVEKDAGDGSGFVAAAGVNVLGSESGAGAIVGGTCDNAGGDTNASGQCTIVVDSDAVGQSTVHASATVSVGGVNIAVSTNGYGAHDVSNVKTWVDARISIGTSGTNKVGDPHTFTVTVEKNLGLGGGWVAAEGVVIDATELGVGTIVDESDCADGTSASGTCLVVVDSDATGQSTVNAGGTVNVGGVNIAVATDGYGANSVSNTKTWVDARITIQTSGTNKVGDPHTFTVTVEKDAGDGSGFVAAAGVVIDATESGVGDIVDESDCADGTSASGTCLVVVDSDATGQSTVHASGTVSVGGVNIAVATDGYGAHDVSNTKTWVDARISIGTSGTNQVGDEHTFTVTVEADYGDGAGFIPVAGVNVLASELGVGSITGGTCDNTGGDTDANGQCTIVVDSDAVGQSTVDASATVNVGGVNIAVATDGYGAHNVSNVKTWVSARITIEDSGTNQVGDPHTFTVTVEADYGDGLGLVPVAGANVLASSTGVGSITGGTCDNTGGDTDANGQCTIVVDSDVTGQATVNASTTIDVDGVSVSIATDGTGGNIIGNVKTWVDARISIETDGTNQVGDPHTFTVTVEADYGDGLGFVPVAGVTVDATEAGVGDITDESDCADGTNASGQCLVVVNSTATGESTVDASATVNVGGVNIDVATDGYGANTVENTKTWVDARISIVTDGVNGITEAHTFTVTVEADYGDGLGFVAVAGANVDASIAGTGTITGGTCDNTGGDTDAAGQCTVIVNSDVEGIGTVDATTTIDVSGVSVTVATDGAGAFTVENTKEWVDGSLTWLKHDNNGQLLGGATFEVCRTHDRFGTDIVDECVTVVDDTDGTGGAAGSGLDEDGAAGQFKLSLLLLGRYTIEETVAPPTYTLDTFVETIELTLADPDKAATHIWVNTPSGEGCTPGFWKNHTAAWNQLSDATVDNMPAGYEFTTTTKFNAYFNLTPAQSGFNNNVDMLGAVKAGGGGEKALARHGVSALLNVAALDAYPIQDFIDLYNDIRNAYINNTEGALADILAGFNNLDHQNCPTS